jgi:hypothetical protein
VGCWPSTVVLWGLTHCTLFRSYGCRGIFLWCQSPCATVPLILGSGTPPGTVPQIYTLCIGAASFCMRLLEGKRMRFWLLSFRLPVFRYCKFKRIITYQRTLICGVSSNKIMRLRPRNTIQNTSCRVLLLTVFSPSTGT